MPAAVEEHGMLRPPCQMLVCGVHVLDGTETHEEVFKENAHTEKRNARCPHVHRRAT